MSLETRKETLDLLSRRLRKRKFMAILLALFTLSVNAFAWFVFSTHSDYTYEGKVASWDVELREGGELVNDFIIAVDMKPGMSDFSKNYVVNNLGDVDAKLSYTIDSVKLMGRTVDLTGISDPVNHLKTFYPFVVDINSDKTVILQGQSANFNVEVSWDFEDDTAYYALNNIYDFDETFKYYTKSGSTYNEFAATSANYVSNRANLYLQKDDADTYFGMKCGAYQESTDLPCLEIKFQLTVEQNA